MPLEIGIVGLPLVGKTTLFNAMTAAGGGGAARQEFSSIKPNVAIVPVPDRRLRVINQYVETQKIVPATMRVVDIAGLARGASEGKGMGNKFLAHIREVDAVLHVVRCFENPMVPHPDATLDPTRDMDALELELVFADLESVTGSIDRAERAARGREKEAVARLELLKKCQKQLEEGKPVRQLQFNDEEQKILKHFGLITGKKVLYVANVGEDDLAGEGPLAKQVRDWAQKNSGGAVAVCGKLESELAELDEKERAEMLEGMGLKEPALAALTREAYRLLGLHCFFTAGPEEIRAWQIPIGAKGPQAAGAVHTDLEKSFIKAQIYTLEDLQTYKTEAAIKAAGKLRLEGKDYVMKDGDITHFQAGLAGKK
jgi:ribosome-binding ATPase